MKKYIGTKIIEAEPAYRVVDADGNVRVVTEAAEAKRCGTVDLGYKVRYPDGYESFSPKGAFDDAYHPIDGMNFGLPRVQKRLERQGHFHRASDAGRLQQNDKPLHLHRHDRLADAEHRGAEEPRAVVGEPDRYAGRGLGDLRLNENGERGSEQMFRYKKSVPVSYERQGYIYFASRLYRELTEEQQHKLLNLCLQCGGEHYQALFEFVTTDAGATAVCMKHFLSRSTLERAVRRYYESFPQNL